MHTTETIVAVLGAGTMGHGIAQVCAQAGYATRLYDVTEVAAQKGHDKIKDGLARVVAKGKLGPEVAAATVARITPTGSLEEATKEATVIIEAAPEQMALKVDLLNAARAHAHEDVLIGSNTSSLSITELGKRIDCADRVIGLHFFNPPPVMELVEVVRGFSTSSETEAKALSLVRALGKTPIVVRDFPGFATSRLGVCIGAEAMRMLEQGVGTASDIDRAMELGYRHPMGPLKLTDLVGLDVRLAILEHLHRELGEVFRPPPLLRQLVRAGRLGKKTGSGFYLWTADGPQPLVHT